MEQTHPPAETHPPAGERDGKQRWAGLTARVYSALVLGVISLGAAYTGGPYFVALVAVTVLCMAWEWGRLVRNAQFDGVFWAHALATGAAVVAAAAGCPGCGVAVVTAGGAAAFWMRKMRPGAEAAWWSALGVLYTGLPGVALVWLRSDLTVGFETILYLFVVVWATDTAAYFSGRLIGGPKLAPWISPKKTWAGLGGGAAAAALVGASYAVLSVGAAFLAIAALSLVMALVSQIGDLAESAVKRTFGAKDASSLIPGHGGVLDRLDGLISVAVAAGLIALLFNPAHPGRAVLLWSW